MTNESPVKTVGVGDVPDEFKKKYKDKLAIRLNKDGEFELLSQKYDTSMGEGKIIHTYPTAKEAVLASIEIIPTIKEMHKRRMETALINNWHVEEGAIERYPEFANINWLEKSIQEDRKYDGKADWEMTKEEILSNVKLQKEVQRLIAMVWAGHNSKPSWQTEALELHEGAIQNALKYGKPVPAHVLAEYPELSLPG
jgi:hypothetical protein